MPQQQNANGHIGPNTFGPRRHFSRGFWLNSINAHAAAKIEQAFWLNFIRYNVVIRPDLSN